MFGITCRPEGAEAALHARTLPSPQYFSLVFIFTHHPVVAFSSGTPHPEGLVGGGVAPEHLEEGRDLLYCSEEKQPNIFFFAFVSFRFVSCPSGHRARKGKEGERRGFAVSYVVSPSSLRCSSRDSRCLMAC